VESALGAGLLAGAVLLASTTLVLDVTALVVVVAALLAWIDGSMVTATELLL
jgi:hypothetical protein